MKIIALVILFVTTIMGCHSPKVNTIHLKGQMADMGTQEVIMEYTGVTGDFGTSLNRIIKTDASGYFDTTFVLEQPMYFNISRNILYLSPGDDLEVYLTPDTRQATFKGKGSEAQLFLKDRLYPKGGSFLLSGRNVRENFEKTKEVVDALAASKLAQLDTLKGITELFKENERIRVKANLLNSYLTYALYNKENAGASREEQRQWYGRFITSVIPDVNQLMREITKNEYLDIIDVRDVIVYNLDQAEFMQGVEITPEMREIKDALQVLAKLDSSTDPEAKPFALAVMQRLNDKCKEWKEAENISYSVYGTPMESTTYKFAKCLQKRFGIIPGVTDKNYITNSYHVHVTEKIDAFSKLKFESEFQEFSSAKWLLMV